MENDGLYRRHERVRHRRGQCDDLYVEHGGNFSERLDDDDLYAQCARGNWRPDVRGGGAKPQLGERLGDDGLRGGDARDDRRLVVHGDSLGPDLNQWLGHDDVFERGPFGASRGAYL